MKAEGKTSGNPFIESFTYPGNRKRIFVALFGITGVLTTIWYTAFFSGLSFLRGPMRVEESLVEWMLLAAGVISMSFYILIGRWSDRIGRKLPIILGAGLSLILLFPIFWGMGALANPGLAAAAERTPVLVTGQDCTPDPFAELFGREQSECGKVLDVLTSSGVRYDLQEGDTLAVSVGGERIALADGWFGDDAGLREGVRGALTQRGFDFGTQVPPLANILGIVGLLLVMGVLSALTYGSVAALLAEMFPPQIRYSSMSIPYHIGAGYLGGFLPLIAGIIVARSGDIYAGLWYTWIVVAFGILVAWWGLPGGPPRDFEDR
jgi:MFS family permease